VIFKLVYGIMFKCAFSLQDSSTLLSKVPVLAKAGRSGKFFNLFKGKSVFVFVVHLKVKDMV